MKHNDISTPANPSRPLDSSVASSNPPLDWHYPFYIVTTAFVAAGALFLLRAIFPRPDRWAEAFTLLIILAWTYWAHKIGLFLWPSRPLKGVKGSARQSVVNALACAFLFFVVFSWRDGLTSRSLGSAFIGALIGASHSTSTRQQIHHKLDG